MRFTIWQALLLLLAGASAQILTPSNNTSDPRYHDGDGIELGIWHQQNSGNPVAAFPVTALTRAAGQDIANTILRGEVLLTDAQNQLLVTSRYISLISCDPPTSNLGPDSIFNTAKTQNATAVVLYSLTAQSCHGSGFGSYQNVFTLKSLDNAREMLAELENQLSSYAILATRDVVTASNGTNEAAGSNSSPSSQQQPGGPTPSTAVAMIILYSITGVITALFLCIIITGAIRAHRHPERYGPRNLIGRPRQTRARGLARAMLDSLPIVKVGDRTDQTPKPNEVELENGQHGPVEQIGDQTTAARGTTADGEPGQNGVTSVAQPGSGAAAGATERSTSSAADESSSPGCSICTEDFEVGEDQRVLPCDHRFHPACIDPWLLNVSGTCPLCRIDLRPAETNESGEVDEHGNAIARDGLAPPLDNGEGSRGARVRRSIMIGIMGAARPERMSREERLAALRRYRENAAARAEVQRQATAANQGQPEGETSRRRRYRDLFRIRTRRTGEQETVREEPAQEAAADNPTTTSVARDS
ncbi:Putative Zinc finger, RING-type [Septoria linicola]|uniref:Zinc finger, RING-type n=1 Tax=Septoria linicola TaxID=215465 RepID=A0A9Q9AV00_9PEZI|nr:putative Zinc finger, RING-type [Septoria linicola]USW55329.1 Putative Zinc finger, RING-type [Septoria linicola]